ncbi:MAG: tRNA pseudouridine(38-40) synthase TruA [Chloroflexi bacterium]|nr:tRNA pseudouridine(38-40) synthase TruA [Chloroflexota bacterium]
MRQDGTRIVLKLEYDGAGYCGFQLQPGVPTVQGEIEKALYRLTGECTRVTAASRTDTGVHASGQMVSFQAGAVLGLPEYVSGLNYYLDAGIAVKAAYRVDRDFDVRKAAASREYRYSILSGLTRSPLRHGSYFLVRGRLDMENMNEACRVLVGRHDFAAFTTSYDRRLKDTVRTIERAAFTREGDLIVFTVVAGSFLQHQVRNIVGSLVRVGLGRMTVADFCDIVKSGGTGKAGPRAPAAGLCLTRVNYPAPFWEEKWGDQ